MKIDSYSVNGKKETVEMPKDMISGVNLPLLAQSIRVYESGCHVGLSKAKTRAQIIRTKAKAYKQKGTGNARHGAKSAPIFVGGGTAHGPKGIKRKLILPKNIKNLGKKVALTLKANNNDLALVDLSGAFEKTKKAGEFINKILEGRKNKKVTIFFSSDNKNKMQSFRNLKDVILIDYKHANSYNIYFGGQILIDKKAVSEKNETKKSSIVDAKNSKSVKKVAQKTTKVKTVKKIQKKGKK